MLPPPAVARQIRPLPLLLAGALACSAAAPATAPAPRYAAHPGFDAYYYPGDAAMLAWRAPASPYEWVGYYLTAPCHRDPSWTGRRAALSAMGWGIAVLYVGQQTWEAQAEAFPAGTVIYLDVERMDSVSGAMRDYVRAWSRALLADGRYHPGLYVHARNAAPLADALRGELAAAGLGGEPRLWVASAAGFDLSRTPAESGHPPAVAWQGAFDVRETWGGVTLRIDANVARHPDPSAPGTAASAAAPAAPPPAP
jgi:hypothetical protein